MTNSNQQNRKDSILKFTKSKNPVTTFDENISIIRRSKKNQWKDVFEINRP